MGAPSSSSSGPALSSNDHDRMIEEKKKVSWRHIHSFIYSFIYSIIDHLLVHLLNVFNMVKSVICLSDLTRGHSFEGD